MSRNIRLWASFWSGVLGFFVVIPFAAAATDLELRSVVFSQLAPPFATTTPYHGEAVWLRASLRISELSGSANIRIEAQMDGGPVYNLNNLTVSNGNRVYFLGGWIPTPGAHTFTVTIDADNVVTEGDETNNTLDIPLALTTLPPTTLPQKFLPSAIGGAAFNDWSVVNYVDVLRGNGEGLQDFTGGVFTYDQHNGHDLTLPNFARMDQGVPIVAAAEGTVITATDGNFDRNVSTAGQPANTVVIDHGVDGWKTIYTHMMRDTLAVKVGDTVSQGQLLGLAGSSGNSTDAHLHWSVERHGALVEPRLSGTNYYENIPPLQEDQPTTILDLDVTNYNPSGAEYKERPGRMGVYSTATPQNVRLWFRYSHFNAGDRYAVKWYRPDGSLSNTFNHSPGASRYGIHHWVFGSGAYAAFPGTWRVEVQMNTRVIGRAHFDVVTGPGASGIKVYNGSTYIIDNRTTAIDFASTSVGGAVATRTFTIQNHGQADLTIQQLNLPPGFSLNGPFPSTVSPGGEVTFKIDMDTTRAGSKFGSIEFETNDPDVPLFNFMVEGEVLGAAPANAPFITLSDRALAYTVRGQKSVIDADLTLADADTSDFNGGSLTVEFVTRSFDGDQIGLQDLGTAPGEIGVSGQTVSYGGTPFGTFTGGASLAVTLSANARLEAVEALLRSVTFCTTGGVARSGSSVRYIRFGLEDDAGNLSNLPIAVAIERSPNYDFGDAPASYGAAQHLVSGNGSIRLGLELDAEYQTQYSENAYGDDNDGAVDEDGVTLSGILSGGTSAWVNVEVQGFGARLDAWFDWNRDGDWDDNGEQIVTNLAMVVGENMVNVEVPSDARNGATFARFRLSTIGGLAHSGIANDGEVEDYRFSVSTSPVVSLALSGSPMEEAGGTATVMVKLPAPSVKNVIVDLVYAGTTTGEDYSSSHPASVTIPVNSTSVDVVLTATSELNDGEARTIEVSISQVSGGSPGDPSVVVATITDNDLDTDNDTLPDGIDPDDDNDAMTDDDELLAGTNPRDADSNLSIDRAERRSSNVLRFYFLTVLGKQYSLVCRPELLGPLLWEDTGLMVSGDGGIMYFDLPSPNLKKVYRIKLEP